MIFKGLLIMPYPSFKILFCFSVMLLALIGSLAFAHDGVKNKDVQARMVLMSNMASNMKVIGKMARNPAEFDRKRAEEALLEIARLSEQTPDAFKKEANDPKSEAKAEIWTDFDNFKKLSENLMVDAKSLAGSLKISQNLRPALIKLSKSCKGCHSKFRE